MGWWQVGADTLAGSRFVVSPLAETTASLFALLAPAAAHPGERTWLAAQLPAFRARLTNDPVTARLMDTVRTARWTADYLVPTPTGAAERSFHEELAEIRATPTATVHADLAETTGRPLPAALLRCDLQDRTADLLDWVWEHAVRPDWPRRRRVMEADIIARTERLGRGGWAAVLDDMRPGMRWLGESRLQITVDDCAPRDISAARLLFLPVTPRHRWVTWDDQDHYAVVYTCNGALADAGRAPAPEALGALLGPARARVLVLLGAPMSTTHLVAATGQGLGSVGRHLKVLLDAGLVGRRRAGRSVLYFRGPAGDVLVAATGGREQGRPIAPPPPE
ncbi:helix-turn-helix transcriptional regulator [Streptomyces sp. NBC_00083]|uniref:ArsR/SmtB family transcription factor n=1 Tax=Streptomyces sp. NBC_00083 TaxID=2975647 RepID=UPI002254DB48|nr:ArsR family transcriptional regulator [Streptomyces sp. NBC_00083]MCX5386965.1 ArsR family transcriptional regulator [Streptomyces sp. NBC_00083]